MLDLGYQHEVGGGWTTKYNVTYNDFDFGDTEISSEDILGEVTIEGSVGEDVRLLFGTTYEDHEVVFEENLITLQQALVDSKQLFSLYAQSDYQAMGWLKLVGGLQYNKPHDLSGSVSPRVGMIGNFDSGWGFKLLYGEAFRTSTFVERSIIVPGVITGNPNLLPEEIATTEAQIFRQRNRYRFGLTYYHSKMTDLIERIGFPIEFDNSGEISFDGLELEGRVLLAKGLDLAGSVTYQENENDLGVEGTTLTPNVMAKLGLMYDVGRGYSLGLYDSYFGEPTQVRELVAVVSEVNAPVESFHLVTLNATLDLGRLSGKQDLAGWSLQMFVDNLLDEDIHYPDINGLRVNSVPIRPGRGVFAGIKVDF
jgi:outer membrane receptor protein involved in Fe transport